MYVHLEDDGYEVLFEGDHIRGLTVQDLLRTMSHIEFDTGVDLSKLYKKRDQELRNGYDPSALSEEVPRP